MDPIDINRVMVTGANGMIASHVPFGQKVSRADFDITCPAQVASACDRLNPSGILHLAAHGIRQCELDPRMGYRTNVLGAYYLALEAEARSIPFVLLSSGAVFNGPRGAVFTEESPCDPVNLYGQTKHAAELLACHVTPRALVVRTGWVFGGHDGAWPKFIDSAIVSAERGEPIVASGDHDGSPTLVTDLVRELQRLILAEAVGVVHVVNDGAGTAADVAREISTLAGSTSMVREVSASDIQPDGPKRSSSEALVSRRTRLRPWREALKEYVVSRTRSDDEAHRSLECR